jgi:hypothetical protein
MRSRVAKAPPSRRSNTRGCRPRRGQDLVGHLPGRILQGERDHQHSIQRADHGQELRYSSAEGSALLARVRHPTTTDAGWTWRAFGRMLRRFQPGCPCAIKSVRSNSGRFLPGPPVRWSVPGGQDRPSPPPQFESTVAMSIPKASWPPSTPWSVAFTGMSIAWPATPRSARSAMPYCGQPVQPDGRLDLDRWLFSRQHETSTACLSCHPIFCRMPLDHPNDHPDDPSGSRREPSGPTGHPT